LSKIDAYQIDLRSSKGVMRLTARERVLMIRLMEKLEKYTTYAKTLGIEAAGVTNNQNGEKIHRASYVCEPLCVFMRR
jgi:hypothetical protein